MDGASFRVHHFARQLASSFRYLLRSAAKRRKIEVGTAVIDMRYENAHYVAQDAGAWISSLAVACRRGISCGSPEQVIDGWHYFAFIDYHRRRPIRF